VGLHGRAGIRSPAGRCAYDLGWYGCDRLASASHLHPYSSLAMSSNASSLLASSSGAQRQGLGFAPKRTHPRDEDIVTTVTAKRPRLGRGDSMVSTTAAGTESLEACRLGSYRTWDQGWGRHLRLHLQHTCTHTRNNTLITLTPIHKKNTTGPGRERGERGGDSDVMD
jgi:hypothetical protein